MIMELKDFMNQIWDSIEINGQKVVNRRVCYGSLPDLEFQLEDGSFVSAKDLFENVSKTS
jgi:hypothetical protein